MGERSQGRPEGSKDDSTREFSWESSEDLTALSVEELRDRLERLVEDERRVSYKRRVLQGRIDLIRAEIVQRGGATFSAEELARVLLDRESGDEGSGNSGNSEDAGDEASGSSDSSGSPERTGGG